MNAVTTALAIAAVVPAAQVAAPATGLVGFLNGIVTNLLNPFLAPAPATGDRVSPVLWAVLGWVRRNLFNQSPTITSQITTGQTGQTVTGDIDATDAENDALAYTVTKQPLHGTVTIDHATGIYTYTPNDINYEAAQTDSFTVTVTDGKFNLLSAFSPHSDQTGVDVNVLSPEVNRVILNMPDSITNPRGPRFSADGNSVVFVGTPTAGGRAEVYQINVDGTDVKCLTCGLAPDVTSNMVWAVQGRFGAVHRLGIESAV